MSIILTPKQISYLRPIVGTVVLIIGLVSMLLPFLPLGYIFTLGGLLILSSRIPVLRRFLRRLEKKDKKGRVKKVNEKVSETEERVERKVSTEETDV